MRHNAFTTTSDPTPKISNIASLFRISTEALQVHRDINHTHIKIEFPTISESSLAQLNEDIRKLMTHIASCQARYIRPLGHTSNTKIVIRINNCDLSSLNDYIHLSLVKHQVTVDKLSALFNHPAEKLCLHYDQHRNLIILLEGPISCPHIKDILDNSDHLLDYYSLTTNKTHAEIVIDAAQIIGFLNYLNETISIRDEKPFNHT